MNLVIEHKERLNKASKLMTEHDVSTLLITPGPNLRYFTGYKAKNLERLTCLVLQENELPKLIVPKLEKLAAIESGINEIDVEIITWDETESAFEKVQPPKNSGRIAVDSNMNSSKLLNFQKLFADSRFTDAGFIMNEIRSIKSGYEIDQLLMAGKYIDEVHRAIPSLFQIGDTEISLAKKIGNQIIEAGHESVDFTIVASGKNSASPHHEPGETVIKKGDVLVIDIGGTTPSGYCSDSTRTYVIGECSPDFQNKYEILKQAQELSIQAVCNAISAEQLDAVARDHLRKNDLAEYFIHRTGHGIGMETHEEPYIVHGNKNQIKDGNAFSIEPGFYIEGKYGARIEDIVIKTGGKSVNCNNTPKDLVFI
jgi:Xaa-Pro aminopeptidase